LIIKYRKKRGGKIFVAIRFEIGNAEREVF